MPFGDTLRDIQAHLQADQVGLPEDTWRPTMQAEQDTKTLEQSHIVHDQEVNFDYLYWSDSSDHGTVHTRDSYTTLESEWLSSPENVEVKDQESELGKLPGGLLAPSSYPKTFVRNGQNLTRHSILIEPTAERQRFYNMNRREMERHRLELNLEEGGVSWSTKSDSHPSRSTVCSQSGNSITPSSPDPAAEAVRSKSHGVKRKRPLDEELRTKTAFKRKFKLICRFHRAKRVSVSLS